MVKSEYSDIDNVFKIEIDDTLVTAKIVEKPFFDANKLIAKQN